MKNANGVIKKLTSAERSYYTAAEVREMMGVSRDTAYRMIRSLRSDLIADGQLAKVNKKLSGNCMLCGKTEDKNKMVTLTARAVRGGKATSFGHMCHSCFAKWLTSHNIPVPDLENKKEIEDGKEKL